MNINSIKNPEVKQIPLKPYVLARNLSERRLSVDTNIKEPTAKPNKLEQNINQTHYSNENKLSTKTTISDRCIELGDFAYKRMWWVKDICAYIPMILTGLNVAGSEVMKLFPLSAAIVEFLYCASRIFFWAKKSQQIAEIENISTSSRIAQKAIELLNDSKKNAAITGAFEAIKCVTDIMQVVSIKMPPLYLAGILAKLVVVVSEALIKKLISKQDKKIEASNIDDILQLAKSNKYHNKELILKVFGFDENKIRELNSKDDTWGKCYIKDILESVNIQTKPNENNGILDVYADSIVDATIYGTDAATKLEIASDVFENTCCRGLIYIYTAKDLYKNCSQISDLNKITTKITTKITRVNNELKILRRLKTRVNNRSKKLRKLKTRLNNKSILRRLKTRLNNKSILRRLKTRLNNKSILRRLKEKYDKKFTEINNSLLIGKVKFLANTLRTLGQLILPALPMLNVVGVTIYLLIVFSEIYQWYIAKEKDYVQINDESYNLAKTIYNSEDKSEYIEFTGATLDELNTQEANNAIWFLTCKLKDI